jgi:hypothetical protein
LINIGGPQIISSEKLEFVVLWVVKLTHTADLRRLMVNFRLIADAKVINTASIY